MRTALDRLRAGAPRSLPRPSVRRLPRPALLVPALLVAAQWGVAGWVASSAAHSGWVYGDPAETAALHGAARAVVDGHLPSAGGGFLWPLLTAPFAAAGAQPGDGLAALVVIQVAVLLPLALLAVAGTAARIAGRAFGTLAGLLWILLPVVAYRYFDFRFRPVMHDRFLPQLLGLAETTVFPTMVALAVAGYFLARTLASGRSRDALATGLATSAALALSGVAILFLPAALAAIALRRRRRALGAATLAAVPGLVALALWHLHAPQADAPLLHFDWGTFHANLMGFREYFWSLRVVEWLPIAGTIALARRSLAVTVGAACWFWLLVLLRGGVPQAQFVPGTFLQLLLPAFPAFVVLVAALPLLVPRLPARLAPFPGPRAADDGA